MGIGWWVALACAPKSETVEDPEAGANGGFEVFRDGLPAQWQVYTPRTVPTGAFLITSDSQIRVEGERSLRFDVQACAPDGGWRSPGIAQEWVVEPGVHRVEVWVRSERAAARVRAGAVTASDGDVVDLPEVTVDGAWHRVEQEVDVPAGSRLRFELSVVAPGTVWVDGFRADRISGAEVGSREP